MRSFLQQRWRSFGYAFKGLATLFRTQAHAWIHLVATVVVVTLGLFFGVETWEWIVLILCITLVIAAEAFNTAIEFLTDLASPDFHPLAGHAKDTAAAAVLICAIGAATCGLFILGPYFLSILSL